MPLASNQPCANEVARRSCQRLACCADGVVMAVSGDDFGRQCRCEKQCPGSEAIDKLRALGARLWAGKPSKEFTVMRTEAKSTAHQYKEVRGLARGLDVLKALNRVPGGIASTTELAKACALDRTTTKRLLETLRTQGL